MFKSLCVLGRQPALGSAELESLYGRQHIRVVPGAALLDLDVNEVNFKGLGGTIKLAKILNILPTAEWHELEKYLIDNIPAHLKYVPAGKFTLGLSVYGLRVNAKTINNSLLKLKKTIKSHGRPVRVVPNKQGALNSAQVLHNKLTSKGAWELLLVADGKQTILAQSMFVQDIEAYAARDQARPKRDSKVGMLPPKLAQILINLADPPSGGVILDPFCGTGVVLQEALLMGYEAVGTDIEPRMVDYARQNLEWLRHNFAPKGSLRKLAVADATSHKWPSPIDAVVAETYLGPPLAQAGETDSLTREIGSLLTDFLKNLSPQLQSQTRLALAVPAWRSQESFVVADVGNLTDIGYNHIKFQHATDEELIYWRQGQLVGRKLVVLEKV